MQFNDTKIECVLRDITPYSKKTLARRTSVIYWQSRVPRPLLASMKNWHKIAPSRQAKITYINKERIYLTDTEVQNSDSGQNQNQIPIETP